MAYDPLITFESTIDKLEEYVNIRLELRKEIFKFIKSNRELVQEASPYVYAKMERQYLADVKDSSLVVCCRALVDLKRKKQALDEAVRIIVKS